MYVRSSHNDAPLLLPPPGQIYRHRHQYTMYMVRTVPHRRFRHVAGHKMPSAFKRAFGSCIGANIDLNRESRSPRHRRTQHFHLFQCLNS